MTRAEVLSRGFAARPSAEDALACGRPRSISATFNPLNRGTGPYIGKKRNCARASLFFCLFLYRHHKTTTWMFWFHIFWRTLGTRQRLPFSFPELRNNLLEFNSRKICQHLTNWGEIVPSNIPFQYCLVVSPINNSCAVNFSTGNALTWGNITSPGLCTVAINLSFSWTFILRNTLRNHWRTFVKDWTLFLRPKYRASLSK